MKRPERQRNHLAEKIATKEARSHKKPGKRTKRWRKFLAAHTPAEATTAS